MTDDATRPSGRERFQEREAELLAPHLRAIRGWAGRRRGWFFVHYFLGTLGIFLSTLLAAKPKWFGLSEDLYGLLAWVLALSTGLLTFFGASDRAGRYRRAWFQLTMAVMLFRVRRNRLEDVLGAYRQGEAIIHESTSSLAPISPDTSRPQ